ncbi:hypothetical protein AKJ16_DCAP13646 [Drosera capensis]
MSQARCPFSRSFPGITSKLCSQLYGMKTFVREAIRFVCSLLSLWRHCSRNIQSTSCISMYSDIFYTFGVTLADLNVQTFEVLPVKDLGNRSVFLGSNESISPEDIEGCVPNSIYFIDDDSAYWPRHGPGGHNMETAISVFNSKREIRGIDGDLVLIKVETG